MTGVASETPNNTSLCRTKCAFGLCVKNNSAGLPKVFDNINKVRGLFDDISVIAYYDASSDDSLALLSVLGKHYNIPVYILNGANRRTPRSHRTVNIARARNGILGELYMNPVFDKYELFAMMDSNDYSCQGDIQPGVLRRYLTYEFYGEWDALSFAREPYYDLWAYSSGVFQLGCWSYPPMAVGGGATHAQYRNAMVGHINNTILAKENAGKLIEVDSAFCGFALYKKDVFYGCYYNGLPSTTYFDPSALAANLQSFKLFRSHQKGECEHRHFHMMAKRTKGAKVMVACDQVFGPSERTKHV